MVYIGRTKNLQRRIEQHTQGAQKPRIERLYVFMNSCPSSCWCFTVLAQGPLSLIRRLESENIINRNTKWPHGLNMRHEAPEASSPKTSDGEYALNIADFIRFDPRRMPFWSYKIQDRVHQLFVMYAREVGLEGENELCLRNFTIVWMRYGHPSEESLTILTMMYVQIRCADRCLCSLLDKEEGQWFYVILTKTSRLYRAKILCKEQTEPSYNEKFTLLVCFGHQCEFHARYCNDDERYGPFKWDTACLRHAKNMCSIFDDFGIDV